MHAPGEQETPGEPGAYGGLPWPLFPQLLALPAVHGRGRQARLHL